LEKLHAPLIILPLAIAALAGGFASIYLFGLSLIFLVAALSPRKAGAAAALLLLHSASAHHTDALGSHEVVMDIRSGIPFPSEVSFEQGEHAALRVFNHDEVAHTLVVPELGIAQRIPPGEEVLIGIPTEKSGRFPFSCGSYCGPRHYKLEGMIIIDGGAGGQPVQKPFERIPEGAFHSLSLAALSLGLAALSIRRLLW